MLCEVVQGGPGWEGWGLRTAQGTGHSAAPPASIAGTAPAVEEIPWRKGKAIGLNLRWGQVKGLETDTAAPSSSLRVTRPVLPRMVPRQEAISSSSTRGPPLPSL